MRPFTVREHSWNVTNMVRGGSTKQATDPGDCDKPVHSSGSRNGVKQHRPENKRGLKMWTREQSRQSGGSSDSCAGGFPCCYDYTFLNVRASFSSQRRKHGRRIYMDKKGVQRGGNIKIKRHSVMWTELQTETTWYSQQKLKQRYENKGKSTDKDTHIQKGKLYSLDMQMEWRLKM